MTPPRWDETVAEAILGAVARWYATQPPRAPRPPQSNHAVTYRLTAAGLAALSADPARDRHREPHRRLRTPTPPCRRPA